MADPALATYLKLAKARLDGGDVKTARTRDFADHFPVVTGDTDEPHLAFFAEPDQFLADFIGILFFFHHAQEQEDIDAVRSQLP